MDAIACTSCGKANPFSSQFCSHCGVPLPEPIASSVNSALTAGTRLRDRYVIVLSLGRGGMGRTYLAEDRGRFNEWVTIKELTPVIRSAQVLQKAEQLFRREAAILHKLSSPQIPRFWEFFREGNRLFLVQDYIEGKTYQTLLEERIEKGQCFSEAEIIELLWQLLPVLSYLHSSGLVHRDISPDNIICRTLDGLTVLIDLGGVAQIPRETDQADSSSPIFVPSQSPTRLGKSGYSPEEQLRLGLVAPHCDLYALGVTSLVLMTGKQPQDLFDPHTLNWVWPEDLTLSPRMNYILNRMLAPHPIDRFHSANDVVQYLLATSSGIIADRPPLIDTFTVAPQAKLPQTNNTFVNNSGLGRLSDSSVSVPEEIQGWNWGAFFFPGLWCIPNQIWVGLMAWTGMLILSLPFILGLTWSIMAIVLGVKGNEWAWKSRRWKSLKAFKRHQRLWAIAGFGLLTIILLVCGFIVLMILALGKSLY